MGMLKEFLNVCIPTSELIDRVTFLFWQSLLQAALSRAKAPLSESKKGKKKKMKDQKKKNLVISNGIKRDYSSNEALLKHAESPDSLQNPLTLMVPNSEPPMAMVVEEDVWMPSLYWIISMFCYVLLWNV